MLSRKLGGEALRFVIVGAAATALHYGLYLLLVLLMPANPAYIIGYVVSFLGNFYATSRFTFRREPSLLKFVGMAGAHAVNFLLHLGLLNLFLWLGVRERLAPVPVYCVAVPVNFLLLKHVFKR
ncbi:MAG: GtrA family protein [Prevotellaceae bacterium]|nr:GtrA family protein [Prevotellaceae bacterium]MCD8304096.1 GtrA family protein [Prevotellaceae bacterium]